MANLVALALERGLDNEFEKAGQPQRIAKRVAFEQPIKFTTNLIDIRCVLRRLEGRFPPGRVRLHSQVALLKSLAADAPLAILTSAFC